MTSLFQVAVTRTFFEAGAHSINAIYSGDLNYQAATPAAPLNMGVWRLTPKLHGLELGRPPCSRCAI